MDLGLKASHPLMFHLWANGNGSYFKGRGSYGQEYLIQSMELGRDSDTGGQVLDILAHINHKLTI